MDNAVLLVLLHVSHIVNIDPEELTLRKHKADTAVLPALAGGGLKVAPCRGVVASRILARHRVYGDF